MSLHFAEKMVQPWSSLRTLKRDGERMAVDKPAQCATDLQAFSMAKACAKRGSKGDPITFDSLSERLELAGLGTWTSGDLSYGISGACWLRQGESRPNTIALPDVLVREVVLGIASYRGASRGTVAGHEFQVLSQDGERVLLSVRTLQAPTQVSTDFASAGYRVVGLVARGQTEAWPSTRPLIHVRRIEAEGLPQVVAPLPPEFHAWLQGRAQRPPSEFEAALAQAGVARFRLQSSRQAVRLVGEGSGELAGITVDCYGKFAVVAISSQAAASQIERLAEFLMDNGAKGVYVKVRAAKDLRAPEALKLSPALPFLGEAAPEVMALAMGPVQLQVRLGQGHSTGLFLDQAANWPRMAAFAAQGSLLNLFCYTGAFTVYAAAAGVQSSVSVDLSGSALRHLGQNLALNQLSGNQHRLLKNDAITWLKRANRRPDRYDSIVLDPPSFGTRARGVLNLQRDYEVLLSDSLNLLTKAGSLLSVVHHRGLSFEQMVETAKLVASRLGHEIAIVGLAGDWDCPTVPGVSGTKNLLISRRG